MAIKFTQYLRPNGKKVSAEIDMPEDIESMARRLSSAGYKFEIEELSTGVVHMDCSADGAEGPVAIELCENGPPVVFAVERLVRESHEIVFGKTEECHV